MGLARSTRRLFRVSRCPGPVILMHGFQRARRCLELLLATTDLADSSQAWSTTRTSMGDLSEYAEYSIIMPVSLDAGSRRIRALKYSDQLVYVEHRSSVGVTRSCRSRKALPHTPCHQIVNVLWHTLDTTRFSTLPEGLVHNSFMLYRPSCWHTC